MGQLSDPFGQGEEEGDKLDLTLPGDLYEPDPLTPAAVVRDVEAAARTDDDDEDDDDLLGDDGDETVDDAPEAAADTDIDDDTDDIDTDDADADTDDADTETAGTPTVATATAGLDLGSGDADDQSGPLGSDDEATFELDDWSDLEREAATDRLQIAGVPHWWVEGTLFVAKADAELTESVLEGVEGDRREPLDVERDQVAYDLAEWEDDQLTLLEARLDNAGIAFGWDGDELFVYAEDEEVVDGLVDAVDNPDEIDAESDDGAEGDLLGRLFLLADRLQRDLDDHEAVVTYAELAEAVEGSDPPYGLAERDWEHLRERVTALAELLVDDDTKDDELVTAAGDLRNSLRPYV